MSSPSPSRCLVLVGALAAGGCPSREERAPAPPPAPSPAIATSARATTSAGSPAAPVDSASASGSATPSPSAFAPAAPAPAASADGPPAPEPAPPDGSAALPPVGSTRIIDKLTSTSVRTMFQGRDVVIGNVRRENVEEKILAVGNGGFRKLEVRYGTSERVRSMSGSDQKAPTALAGRTFVVERKGTALVVTTPEGEAVAADIASEVRKDHGSLGQREPLYGALPAKLPARGERVPSLEAALEQYFADLGDAKNVITARGATATVDSTSAERLTFRVTLEVRMEASTQTFEAKLAGVYEARAKDRWPAKLDVSGPADVTLFSSKTRSRGELAVRRTLRH